MHRLAPPLLVVLVTALLAEYGRFRWSWLAGPLAGAALFLLERQAREPAAPAPRHREPAPVD